MNYENPEELRQALLKHIAEQSAGNEDLRQRLTNEVAFERLLARLGPEFGFVIGGIATKYLLPDSPATKDVDVFLQRALAEQYALAEKDTEARSGILYKLVQKHLRQNDTSDHFDFAVSDEIIYFTDQGQNQMSAKLDIEVSIADQRIAKFPLEIGIPDHDLPQKKVKGKDKLGFAGIKNPEIAALCPEFVLADKAIIYQKNQMEPGFDRVGDVIHMTLLIQNTKLNEAKLARGLAYYAVKKGITGTLNNSLMLMRSEKWEYRYSEVARSCNLDLSYKESMELINQTLAPVRAKASKIAKTIKPLRRNAGSIADETTKFLLDAAKNRRDQDR